MNTSSTLIHFNTFILCAHYLSLFIPSIPILLSKEMSDDYKEANKVCTL